MADDTQIVNSAFVAKLHEPGGHMDQLNLEMTKPIVKLPEAEFLAFRKQASYVATHGIPRHHELLKLAELGKALDEAWIKVQPEYAPGLNSPKGPAIARNRAD